MSKSRYAKIIDFGSQINSDVKNVLNTANPLTYCTFPTLNSQFLHGSSSSGALYSSYNQKCMAYMGQYCAENWNSFCDAYAMVNPESYWPNQAVVDVMAQNVANVFLKYTPTMGDNLLRNAAMNRFIEYPGLQPKIQQFDPTVANSPYFGLYPNYITNTSHLKNLDGKKEDLDKSVLVQRMLQNPKACFDVLARIYLGHVRKESNVHIQGTALFTYLEQHTQLFQEFLKIAMSKIPSFQPNRPYVPWNVTPCL